METAMNGFDEFWKVYPRRVAKQAAMKAYKRALKLVPPDTILRGAERYAEKRRGEDINFTKHPTTWLNGGCWDDDLAGLRPTAKTANGAIPAKVFVRAETDQWRAWTRHLGKTPPTTRDFGWFFPTEWPPGHSHEQR